MMKKKTVEEPLAPAVCSELADLLTFAKKAASSPRADAHVLWYEVAKRAAKLATKETIVALQCQETENAQLLSDIKETARQLELTTTEPGRLRKWIEELDCLASNEGDDREWHGDMGWVYPGGAVYYSSSVKPNVPDHPHPGKTPTTERSP